MSDRELVKASLAPTSQCLTPEQLEVLLDGKQSNPHLAACPRCQAELALLKSFESDTPLPDEGAAVAWIGSQLERQLDNIKSSSRARIRRSTIQDFEPQGSWLARILRIGQGRWVVPATALAAAAIVAAIVLRPPKEPDLQANAGNPNLVYRSQEVQVVGPVGELQQIPRELQWKAFPNTGNYKVVVTEVDNSVLWDVQTKATSIEIPASLRARVLPGKPILWQVTALDAEGRVLGTSQRQRFSTPRERSSETNPQPQ